MNFLRTNRTAHLMPIAAAAVLALGATACDGDDLEDAGDEIEETVDDAGDEIEEGFDDLTDDDNGDGEDDTDDEDDDLLDGDDG